MTASRPHHSRPKRPVVRRDRNLEKPALLPQVTTLWDYPSQHYGDAEQGSQAFVAFAEELVRRGLSA